jgi:hypothetical protein
VRAAVHRLGIRMKTLAVMKAFEALRFASPPA